MLTQRQVQLLYTTYIELFPGERERIKLFTDFIDRTATEDLYRRSNFDGHITTSAFIINRERQEILLLRHKTLQRWLQPGGHFEQDASLMASALREAVEETHIPAAELVNIPVSNDVMVPFDIDPHHIPVNNKKQEHAHYHHDVRYLFEYTGEGTNSFNTDEATGLKWVPFTELEQDDTFGKMVDKIRLFI